MKAKLLVFSLMFPVCAAYSQCHYIPSTSTTNDTVIYTFNGGTFASYGCLPIDPTFWLAGYGISVTVTFVEPRDYPVFRVWGMNDDDSAFVTVGGSNYPMNYSSAIYLPKVVCGISPGPDGIIFANDKIVGANSNISGNYSYQDVQLKTTEVSTFTVYGSGGAGWGFAGVLVDCPVFTAIPDQIAGHKCSIYPNPVRSSGVVEFADPVLNAEIRILNLQGQTVKKITGITGESFFLERGNLPAGIYFMLLRQKEHLTDTIKLIISDN